MNLFIALVVAVLFGTGATLVLKPDLFRVVVGLALISNAASLTVIASACAAARPPSTRWTRASRSVTHSPRP
jgi:multicomponent Na+:H+ antiporter subunit C